MLVIKATKANRIIYFDDLLGVWREVFSGLNFVLHEEGRLLRVVDEHEGESRRPVEDHRHQISS